MNDSIAKDAPTKEREQKHLGKNKLKMVPNDGKRSIRGCGGSFAPRRPFPSGDRRSDKLPHKNSSAKKARSSPQPLDWFSWMMRRADCARTPHAYHWTMKWLITSTEVDSLSPSVPPPYCWTCAVSYASQRPIEIHSLRKPTRNSSNRLSATPQRTIDTIRRQIEVRLRHIQSLYNDGFK